MCSSGEFYLSSRNPGPTQPGTPPRDPIWLCYLYHLPAVADAAVGTAPGKFAFNCTENLIPYTTAVDYGLDFDAWMSLGLDEGTTIEEIPTPEEVVAMGVATLMDADEQRTSRA